MKDLTKLSDSHPAISQGGRADFYARTHGLKLKHSKDIVGGADNGIDQFAILRKYNLKGFEYGNYVSNNDRYDHLIACQKALEHLAKIIGTDNLGINAHIGIAFGARGLGGRAAAHYEPRLNMINLTKPSGAGCLAHEYGHALDFNLGSFIDQHKVYAALSGGSSTARTLNDNIGGQLRAMVNKIVDQVILTPSHRQLRLEDCEYWIRRTEIFARFFEQYICYKMRKIGTDKYLTNTWDFYLKSAFYLRESEFLPIVPDADRLIQEIGKFLNGNAQLRTTPYPTMPAKVAATAKPIAKKPAAPATKATKETKATKATQTPKASADYRVNPFAHSKKYTASNGDYRTRPYYKAYAKQVDDLRNKYDATKDRDERKALRKQLKEINDKAVKRNIADLADLTGLSKPLIEALYRTTSDDELRPVMFGIFFDPAGYAVTTDAHILCAVKCKVPAALSGKIITKYGTEIAGKFPNWEAVIDRQTPFLRTFKPDDNTAILKEKLSKEEKELWDAPLCRLGRSWLKRDYVAKAADILGLLGANTVQVFEKETNRATILQLPGKATIIIMPIMPYELDKPTLDKYIPLLK